GVGRALAGADVDDSADGATVAGAEAARVEVDLVDELGADDAGAAAEVEEQRHLNAVHEEERLAGVGSAHHELAAEERSAGDSGEVLDHADRVAERAGYALELAARDAAVDDFFLLFTV